MDNLLQKKKNKEKAIALPSGSHPVDVHVGQRVRELRRSLKLSQTVLADAIGLTFQQVQKYERGTNRISASALFEIARFLGVEVDYFFLGLPDTDAGDGAVAETQADAFLRSEEGVMLAACFTKLSTAERKVVVATVKGLAGLAGTK